MAMLLLHVPQAGAADIAWNYFIHLNVTIDRPAKDVWLYFIGDKQNRWGGARDEPIVYTTIAGKTGQVGEVFTHAALFHGYHLYYERIRVVPDRQVVMKILFRKHESDPDTLAGFDIVELNESEGRATIDFRQAFTLPVEKDGDSPEALSKAHDKELAEAFKELKKAVEGGQ